MLLEHSLCQSRLTARAVAPGFDPKKFQMAILMRGPSDGPSGCAQNGQTGPEFRHNLGPVWLCQTDVWPQTRARLAARLVYMVCRYISVQLNCGKNRAEASVTSRHDPLCPPDPLAVAAWLPPPSNSLIMSDEIFGTQ